MSSHFTSIGLFAPNLPYPSHNFFPSPAWFPPPPQSCIPFVSSRYSQVIPTAINQLWLDQSDQIKAISGLLRTSTSTISYLTGDGFSRALTDSIWLSCHTHEDLQILYWSTFLKLIILHSREKKVFPPFLHVCIISHVHLVLFTKMQYVKQDTELNNYFYCVLKPVLEGFFTAA